MGIRIPQQSTLWAILAGVAYVFCFPRFDLPALSLLVMPGLIFSVHTLRTRSEAIFLGFLLSFMIAVGGFHWIVYTAQNFGQMPLPVAMGLLALFGLVAAPQMVGFFLLGHWLRYRVENLPLFCRPLFWAILYTSLEYLARQIKIFPEHLGNTLIAFPSLAQAASLGGVSLLSFLPLFFGASLAYLKKNGFSAIPSLVCAAFLILGFSLWGKFEIQRLNSLPKETFRVGLVQPNQEEMEKLAIKTLSLRAVEKIIEGLLEHSEALAAGKEKPDLILWPETAYPLTFPLKSYSGNQLFDGYANQVKQFTLKTKIPLFFGGYEDDGQKSYNAAFLLNGETGQVMTTYRKNILLIFGEYFPGDRWFPELKKLNPIMGDFGRGPGPVPVTFFQGKTQTLLGASICYEAMIPEFMLGLARANARLFVNFTKDSWFGDTFEPWQHFQLSALRAIEHRIPMVRVTNTGLSGTVSMVGVSDLISFPFQTAAKTVTVEILKNPEKTLYTMAGEWFVYCCLLLSILLSFLSFRKRA